MRLIILSVLCALPLLVSAEKETETAWEDYGWFALKIAGLSALVIGGTAIVFPALGFTAESVTAGSTSAWFQSTYFGRTITLSNIFAGIQNIGAVGLAISAKVAVGTISVLVATFLNISSKNQPPGDLNSFSESTEANKTKVGKEINTKPDHGNSESVRDQDDSKNTTTDAEEQITVKKMLEILKLLEEINDDLDNED